MPEDGNQTVQNNEQVPEGQTQDNKDTEGVQTNTNDVQQQALSPEIEAKVQQMIAAAVAEAKETGRRELQSQQDRNKAEVARTSREARIANESLKAAEEAMKDESATPQTVELARLRAEQQARADIDKEEITTAQTEAQNAALKESLNSHLKELGIKEDDPRVDWAADAKDYLSGRNRFDASVAKILKEDRTKETESLSKRLEALERQTKGEENVENNSVSTTTPGGGVSVSDKDFVVKFNSGELPMNKANMDRANKIMNR